MVKVETSLCVIFSLWSVALATNVNVKVNLNASGLNQNRDRTSDSDSNSSVCVGQQVRIEELEKLNQELSRRFEVLTREVDELKIRNGESAGTGIGTGKGSGARIPEPLGGPPPGEEIKKDQVEIPEIITAELNRRFESSEQKWDNQFMSLQEQLEEIKLYKNIDPRSITSCSEAMKILPAPLATKQLIYPYGETNGRNKTESVQVVCDFETGSGGWTIIQRRSGGPLEADKFYKGWDDYVRGFGSLDLDDNGSFWLGLENIRALTRNRDQELRIQLEDFQGEKAYAEYSTFSISDSSDFFRLNISGFSRNSTAGDSMSGSHNINGVRFSTMDRDNDGGPINCATERLGAWWYKNEPGWACAHSNLNGKYRQPGEQFHPGQGLVWESWRGATTPLKKTEMKIRKKK